MQLHRRVLQVAAATAASGLLLTGCGGDTAGTAETSSSTTNTDAAVAKEVRLGYFPNVTHGSALVGIEQKLFEKALGPGVTLSPKSFNAGPAAVEAIFSGALDMTFIGPSPAINAYQKSGGKAVRIVAGATSGGAALVVKPGIDTIQDLKGKKVASPQVGNTQDVAMRAHFKTQGLTTTIQGGGDVSIVPQENAQTLETFKAGQIDGAWVPEPWSTRLVQEGGGKVLLDEKTLWPGGRWVTTHLMVRTEFLQQNPGLVKRVLGGLIEATEFSKDNPAEAQAAANREIEKVTSRKVNEAVLAASWQNLEFTVDPVASSLTKQAEDAESVGLLKDVDLKEIYDVQLLNGVLRERSKPTVSVG